MLAMVNLNDSANVVPINLNDELIGRWIKFVDRGEQTTKVYTAAVKRFCRYLHKNNISQPTRDDIIGYRDSMIYTDNLKPSSIKLNLNAVKLFFSWISSEGLYPNIGINIHMPKEVKAEMATHKRAALTAKEAAKVLASMPSDNSEKSLRDKCIMTVMFCCGLRSCEIVRLNVGNMKVRNGKYYLEVWGKGRASATDKVVLPKQCYDLIQLYLTKRKNVSSKQPLFVSTSRRCKNARLETQTVSRMAKKSLVKAGFEGEEFVCHSCRHSNASIALEENVSIKDIQLNLRHYSVKTTEVYLHDRSVLNNPTNLSVADSIFKGVVFNAA